MQKILISAAALASLPLTAAAQFSVGSAAASLTAQDSQFITTASTAGLAEVREGQLAETKGDPAVQAIGRRMVTDHDKANDALKSIAIAKGVPISTSLTPSETADAGNLQSLSGPAFDAAYLASQKTAHEQAIALFQGEAKNGTDPELKKFAAQTLPTLQEHLRMIEAAQK
jgi:putative membrane protein